MYPWNERECSSLRHIEMVLNIQNRWIYMLIVAMDANFRLRSKLQGAVNKNHTLGAGWSYFVDNGPY
jgi:hypothetical protein